MILFFLISFFLKAQSQPFPKDWTGNKHWMEGDELLMEILTIAAKPLATTGKGNEELPLVDSYRVSGYQLARLRRQ